MRGIPDALRRLGTVFGIAPQDAAPPRSRGPKHAPRVPFTVLVVGLLVGGLALLLALNTASAANELRRHALATKDAGIAARVEQLRNDVAASAAPANLAEAAGALGMVPANDPAFVIVGADGSVHVLGSPGPAHAPVLALPHRKKTPTPSKTPSTSKAPSTSAKASKSAGAGKSTAQRTTATSAGPPTPTPTPTVTLPGGTR